MFEKIKFLKKISTYTIVAILPLIIGFILAPINTRYLSTIDVGVINYYSTLTSLFTIIFSFGFDSGYNILFFNSKYDVDDKKKLTANIITLQFISSFLISILVCFFVDIIYAFFVKSVHDFPANPYFFYTIISSITAFPLSLILIYFRNEKKSSLFFLLNVINFLLLILSNIILVNLSKGAFEIISSRVIISVLFFLFTIWFFKDEIFKLPSKKSFYNIFKTSWSLYVYVLILFFSTFVDKYFVERYFDFSRLGIYSMAFVIGSLPQVLLTVLTNLFNPLILSKINLGVQDNKDEIFSILKINFYFILLSVCAITLFAPYMIQLLLGDNFHGSAKFVSFIAYSYVFRMIFGNYQIFLYANNKTFIFTISSLISLVISILFMVFTIPIFDEYAIAFSLVVNRICNIPLVKYFAKKEINLEGSDFIMQSIISWIGFFIFVLAFLFEKYSFYLYICFLVFILIYMLNEYKKNKFNYHNILKKI